MIILKRFFDGVPVEPEGAARVDGASRLRLLTSIVLPLRRPILVAVAGVQYAQTMAQAVIAAAPLLVVLLLFQRQIVEGIATTGLGGQ